MACGKFYQNRFVVVLVGLLSISRLTRFRYPVLIDIASASMGAGFVGTDKSTMSLLSRRRVEEWNGGATRMVKWGQPGADDH